MPRIVRRKSLAERLQAYLNPLDLWLWISEELETRDWQLEHTYTTSLALLLNLVYIVARSNSAPSVDSNDIFNEEARGGWTKWFASLLVQSLSILSGMNAVYTFYRTRHYRLFESSVDAVPSTPSAHRVRVDSSPVSSSPLRYLSSMLTSTSVESRSHPIPSRDVWEIAIWDPTPLSLAIFCLFSPGHVMVYLLFLPASPYDPRPGSTIMTAILVAILLSVQMILLRSNFSQQSKDSRLIHKEVLNEYDIKYVRPLTNQPTRDVGVQFSSNDRRQNFVQCSTPTTILNRGFKIKPNLNYAKHFDPDGLMQSGKSQSTFTANSSVDASAYQTPLHQRDASSPLKPRTTVRQPRFSAAPGDGGSLGVYSHAASPLKKSASTQVLSRDGISRSPLKQERSTSKRSSLPPGGPDHLQNASHFAHLNRNLRRESGRF